MPERQPSILYVGELSTSLREWLHELREGAASADPHQLERKTACTSIIIIGDGVDPSSLEAPLAAIRETLPALSVMWASQTDNGASLLADARFQLPGDEFRLRDTIKAALSQGRRNRRGWFEAAAVAAGLAALLLLWDLAIRLLAIPSYLLPSPLAVARAFSGDTLSYLADLEVTASEAAAGFLLGNLVGAAAAILLYRSRSLQLASLPVLTGLQALPIVAIAPLLAVWLGTGMTSKVAMAAIVCLFPVTSNLIASFGAVDRDLIQLFQFHRASYSQTLSRLLFPASIPALISGLRTSGGLAVVGALVAEFTGSDEGLGHLILTATYRLETDRLFVAMMLSAALGAAFAAAPQLLKLTGAGRRDPAAWQARTS